MVGFKRITLQLARNPDAGFPDGDARRGYAIVAPLDDEGHLDQGAWRGAKARCTVVRTSPDPAEQADGWLSHRGTHWFFRYDEDEEGPDEPLYRLGEHRLVIGDYVSIIESGAQTLVYRISDVRPA